MKRTQRPLTSSLLVGLVVAVGVYGCTEPEEFRGTYQETTPPSIPEDRDYAYRLSLFRFGHEVGGVIRFFEIGEYLNTPDNPYFFESYCDYFGPVVISHDAFRFRLDDGPGGRTFVFQFESVDSSTIHTDLSVLRSTLEETDHQLFQFDLARVPLAVDRNCRQRAFEVTVEFEPYTLEDYPNLALSVVWVGYDEQGRVTRTNANDAYAVSLSTDQEEWATDELLAPSLPPAEGMSAPNYPTQGTIQYSLGYIVLFQDAVTPGEYWYNVVGDALVALSRQQVILYLEGPAEFLEPSVAAVFTDLDDVGLGFGVYHVELDVDGQIATVVEASRKSSDRLLLEEVTEHDRFVFPALLPSELTP